MKFISNSMDRDAACGFLRKSGIRFCCTTRRANRWGISGPFAFATASSTPNKNRDNLTPKPPGAFTGTCGKYPATPAAASWLSLIMPDIITPPCTKLGEKNRNPNSSCSSSRLIVRTLIPLSESGNSFAACAFITGTSQNSRLSHLPWRRNSLSGDTVATRFSSFVRFLNMRNQLRRCV
jgi:hypothetical protein